MTRRDPSHVRYAVEMTRLGMWWEALSHAFWPLGVALAATVTALAFGATDLLSRGSLLWLMAIAGLAILLAAIWGYRRFHRPTREAARARVDATLTGKPLSALRDNMTIGKEDEGAQALWQAHQAQMRRVAKAARPVLPDAKLRWRDPVALRLVGLVALVMALLFAPAGRFGQGIAALGATLRPSGPAQPGPGIGPSWEGWAEPPAYTRRPAIYLNALPEGEVLTLPKGSKLSFRLYGEGAAIEQSIGPQVPDSDPQAPEFTAERDGLVRLAGREFVITVIPDAAPTVEPVVAPDRRADGRFVQPFTAADDNGVTEGKAVVQIDMVAIDRRFGLAVNPEIRPAIEVELPLMATGSRKDVRGQLVSDLSRHPWANLPVTVSLEVMDGIAQQGKSAPVHMILPGRRFFDPLAAALIELRRDLLWSRDNAPRSAEVLRAASWQPDGFMDPGLAEGLRGVIGTLESGPLTEESRNRLAQVLWDAAVALEDGGLADALARMQQAHERLSEAIRNGASPDEIQRLMDELREATDAYTDMLAQQQGADPAEKFDRSPQQGQQITGDQIQQMMDEIQRLMNEGRMAEAQQLLDQFNRMMQNMKVTQGQGGEGQGRQRPMNRLAETLRQQQELADEAMRQMQDQYGQWQPGGEDGQGNPQNQELADRQRELREDLGRQRGLMPGRGTPEGDQARRSLDEAGRAMEEAEQALREGDQAGAMERQAQAIQNMREGMRSLGDMSQNRQAGQEGQPQQGGQENGPEGPSSEERGQRGLAEAYRNQPQTDPLGRSTEGNGGQLSTGNDLAEGGDPSRRARDLQDEIRRRSGERERPRDERDYLGRLLGDF